MAQVMKRWCLTALVALAAPLAAHAQDVSDPTRPPAVMTAPLAMPGGVYVVPRAERAQPQLQSILVSLRPGGRRVAVIDGKTLRQGERVGGAVLVAIYATEVVLRRGNKTETLKLFRPAVRVATVQP